MKPGNLIAYLAINCRVEYISDLTLTPRCKDIIEKLSQNFFPLEEWNDVVHYLTHEETIQFESVTEAKQYLLSYPSKTEIQQKMPC